MQERMRRFGAELRALDADQNDKMVIEGRAVVFDTPTVLFMDGKTEFKEVIERSAFDHTEIKDCALKYNHDDSTPILARMRGGSLDIDVREDGVYFRAELFNTSFGRDCYELVRQGALQCSFAFTVAPDGAVYDAETHTRHVRQIDRLFDLSIVTLPAYSDTWVKEARAAFDSDEEKAKAEAEKREQAEAYQARKAALLDELNKRLGGKENGEETR